MRPNGCFAALALGSLLMLVASSAREGLATETPGRRAETSAPSQPPGPLDPLADPAATENAGSRMPVDTAAMKRLIRERAERVSPQSRANAERRLEQAAQRVDLLAADAGDAMLAARLAREFGAPAWVLTRERALAGASWGEVLVAHTLSANSRATVEPAHLLAWRREGMPWSQLAVGLGLSLASAVSAVDEEARVACGWARASGRVAAVCGVGAWSPAPGLDLGLDDRFEEGRFGARASWGRNPAFER